MEECRTDGLESLSQSNAEYRRRTSHGRESQHQSWRNGDMSRFRTESICSLMRPLGRRSELSKGAHRRRSYGKGYSLIILGILCVKQWHQRECAMRSERFDEVEQRSSG